MMISLRWSGVKFQQLMINQFQVLLALYGDIAFASVVICILVAIMVYFVAARAIAENTLLKETKSDLARLKKENAEQWAKLHKNMKKIGKELSNF